jgi:hypothetical protein
MWNNGRESDEREIFMFLEESNLKTKIVDLMRYSRTKICKKFSAEGTN